MNQSAAPVEEIRSPMSLLPVEEGREHFRHALNQILAHSLIGRWWFAVERVLQWFAGRERTVILTATMIALNLFAFVVSTLLSLVFKPALISQPVEFYSPLVWTLFTIVYIRVMHTQLTNAVKILSSTIAESISSPKDLIDLRLLIERAMAIPVQFAFSLIFALIAGVWIPRVLTLYANASFEIGAIALYVFIYFEIGMYIYFLLVVISVLLGLGQFDLDIYANDPSNSPLVRRVYQVCSALTLWAAALGALHYFIMSVHRVDASVPFILTTFIVLGWLPPISLFVTIHLSLAGIMAAAKGKKLAEVQQLIRQVEARSDLTEREQLTDVQQLMDYHDRIRATPNSMINLSSITNLLGTLLLPLIATILGNITTILTLLD